jgi:hypothetical protein
LQFLSFTVVSTGLTLGVNQSKAVILLLILVLFDGVMPSRKFGTELSIAFEGFTDIAS